jgi:YVTN family beta-propeller protein
VSTSGELPVGTVTFLFTDIEGSTQLLKQLGGERYGEALAQHQQILREAFAEHAGHEIDTQGDSFFVAFRRAKDAVSAAIACQRRLADNAWPEATDLRVRMGIHTGEPAMGGERYIGLGVHRAARICAAGHGGQVLLSQTARELLRDDPIPDLSLRDLGEHQLRDLDEPEHLYQLVAPGLQEDFPVLKTAAPAPFEGREGELAEAAAEQIAKSWRRPGRRVLIGATFAAAVVGVVLGVALTLGGGSSVGAAVGANSVGVVDAGSGKVVSQIAVGTSPNAIAVGPDAVWVTNTNDNTVARIDPSTNTLQQTIDVGAGPVGVAVGGAAVWVANGLDGTVSRINPTINREVEKIVVGNGPSGVAYGEGFVWVTNSVDGTVSRIDPSRNRAPRTFPAVAGASGIAVGFGFVWVVSPASGTLVEIDPRSGQVVQPIAVGVDPSAVATGAGDVWVANRGDGTIFKIDPRSASVQGLIRVGSRPTGIAADSRALWVASQGDGTLLGFDPSTAKRIATSELGNPPAGIASAPQGVYVAVQSAEVEHRGGDLRVLLPSPTTSIDPVNNPNANWQILHLTNDGLVGFRKVGGVEGTQLVPDLAVALPKPTDSGKTYTFQVRSGIRYANGRFVQPEDFKHELERLFEVGGLDYGADYSKIVGADRCTAGKPCNLDSGIVVDRTAHTVTFHLTAPDPDFLAKLAEPTAFAVPAGTPARDVGVHPIPATGPYRTAFFGRKEKSVRLVRNRFFHEWSTDAQPQGYPDSISFSWRGFGTDRSAQIRSVERGAGDVVLSGPFAPTASKDAIETLSVRYPSQLHVNTEVQAGYFFLNTRVAPFDDVRVRRAVNIAFDRQLFARVNGRAFAPTCRYLPPGTPGYRPTCPYGAGGVTSLDAARRLVKSSGTAGARVTVWAFEGAADQERFMVSVLDSLGYRARLKVVAHGGKLNQDFTAYYAKVSDSRVGAQTGFIAFLWTWPSATEVLPNIVSCAGFVPAAPNTNSNLSEFCDRSIDAQMAHASAVQAQDPPAATLLWQQVERSLASKAPYVPFYNARAIDFVSKRVGNYRYNPTSGALLSQLWVK